MSGKAGPVINKTGTSMKTNKKKLLTILKNPYDNQNNIEEYQMPTPSGNEKYQTFCGT